MTIDPIVGIGEMLWDVYPDGRKVAGGAPFNFVFHCHQLGHEAVIISRVGNDEMGRQLRAEVVRLGLRDDFIQVDDQHATGTVRVEINGCGVPTYTIADDVAWDFIEDRPQLWEISSRLAAVCFGTLGQRSATSRATIQRFITSGGSNDLRVFDLNIRQHYHDAATIRKSLGHANWLKLNEHELAFLPRDLASIVLHNNNPEQSGVWRDYAPLDRIIITRGEHGCLVLSSQQGSGRHFEPGAAARVVDTVGAGDAFIAAMVCLHREGRSLQECARFATHYAACVCEHPGATPKLIRRNVEKVAFGT